MKMDESDSSSDDDSQSDNESEDSHIADRTRAKLAEKQEDELADAVKNMRITETTRHLGASGKQWRHGPRRQIHVWL